MSCPVRPGSCWELLCGLEEFTACLIICQGTRVETTDLFALKRYKETVWRSDHPLGIIGVLEQYFISSNICLAGSIIMIVIGPIPYFTLSSK